MTGLGSLPVTVRAAYARTRGREPRGPCRSGEVMSENRMAGKVAVVTGAASGIGRAVTLQLLAEGAQVVAADINTERLAETVDLAGSEASLRTVVATLAETVE